MKRSFFPLFLILTVFGAKVSHAAMGVQLTLEPIIGYERSQRYLPTAHTHDHLIYGARAIVGVPLVAGELEYTRGTDNEVFPSQGLTTADTDDQVKLGLRSSISLGSLFSVQARAGGQAHRNTHEQITSGVSTTTVGEIEYRPYAGLGLTAGLGKKLSISGGITAIFNSFPDMSQNTYQTTLGLNVSLP